MLDIASARGPVRRSLAVNPVRLLVPLLACLAGCFTVDGTLKPDGSGTLELTYQVPANATEAGERQRFVSPHVTLDSLTIKGGSAVAKLHVDDVSRLQTAEMFHTVTVSRAHQDDDMRLTITIKNPNPREIKDEGKPGPKIIIRLPGKVREANHQAQVADDRVTWSFSLAEYMKSPSVDLTVRYAGG